MGRPDARSGWELAHSPPDGDAPLPATGPQAKITLLTV